MTCATTLTSLPCNLTGVGYTAMPFKCGTDNQLVLMAGHVEQFPVITAGAFFFITLTQKCPDKHPCDGCCVDLKVTGRSGNALIVEAIGGCPCSCIDSPAVVRYTMTSKVAIEEVMNQRGLNVQSPLTYDCDTHTLGIDCAAVSACTPCNCGSNAVGNITTGTFKRFIPSTNTNSWTQLGVVEQSMQWFISTQGAGTTPLLGSITPSTVSVGPYPNEAAAIAAMSNITLVTYPAGYGGV
jgi:hypothetical protein